MYGELTIDFTDVCKLCCRVGGEVVGVLLICMSIVSLLNQSQGNRHIYSRSRENNREAYVGITTTFRQWYVWPSIGPFRASARL